ncbi:hypothetical protein O181_085341 [Austropuccinia psidii MF-1]|uniref:CP-type G domain-containing protein n=1 Tax=Austropuccinia psidii MF-1 TaxID=1389203 RepID=A0A9Q3FSQ1_9BASI|nr:hypothetical protein [Austropuccinia psidii MF-1]
MPKIRKKPSKRVTTRMREKIKHKVKESHKKAKKQAKKDVTWKSRVKKDIGIPSLFPYKDQLLAEQQVAKAQLAQDKELARKNQAGGAAQSILALASSLKNDSTMDLDEPVLEESQLAPADPALNPSSSIKAHAKSLQKVLTLSDVLIEVLDARDPLGTRSLQLERDAVRQGKKVLLVLNKVDLVPKENIDAWLTYLRRSWPTLPFKCSTQSQRNNLSSKGNISGSLSSNACSTQPLMHLLKNYARRPTVHDPSHPSSVSTVKSLASITVGIIGFPNVGKSSLINTLKRSRVCGVAPTPGFTKEVQEIALEKGLKVLDCPGVVLQVDHSDPSQSAAKVLRNAVKVEQILDPLAPIGVILERCKPEHLMLLYNIPAFTYPGQTSEARIQEFLIQVARSRGRIKKGGIPDLPSTAKAILRDWNMGRIPYYTVPPPLPSGCSGAGKSKTSVDTTDLGTSQIVNELGPEFDLEALFAQADREALGESKTKQELGTVVRMCCEESDQQSNGKLQLLGEMEEEEEEEEAMDGDLTTEKRSLEPEVVSLAPKKKSKKVGFVNLINGTSSQANQSDDVEVKPIGENRQIAKQARKERKKRAKMLASNSQPENEEMEDGTNGTMQNEDSIIEDDQPYSFADFFKGTVAVSKSF